jgi:uncharacterized protein YcfJ
MRTKAARELTRPVLEAVMNNRILAGIAALVLGTVSVAQADGRHDRADDRDRDRYDRDYRDRDYDRRDRHDHRDRRARVIDVDPIYERVRYTVPVEHCWDERVRYSRGSNRTEAAIVGGALGAVIGNRVGDGRDVATVAGAIAGAALGSELASDGRKVRHGHVRRCEVRHEERFDRRVVAYRVTYELRGRRDVTRLAYNPGRYFEVADYRRRG